MTQTQRRPLSSFRTGDIIEGYYLLNDIQLRTGSGGKPYLSANLAEAEGSLAAKCWDYSGPLTARDSGTVVWIRGEMSEYRGTPQVIIRQLRPTDERDSVDTRELIPTAPIDPEAALADVKALIASIIDDDYRAVCEDMFSRHLREFSSIPAAKSVHHAFRGGLMMHTLNMLRTADHLAKLYSNVIDRSLLLTGTLLHDFGKAREFSFSRLGLVTEYSIEGDLLGHLYMGAREVAETAGRLGIPQEKSMLLQHMLLSHHGSPEFGAAVVPKCAEAELLSLIDMIDSRMEIYAETFETVPTGAFSPRIFALEKRIYRHELPEERN